MRRLHFLVNLQAGRGRAQTAWSEVKSHLNALGLTADKGGYTVSDALDMGFEFSRLAPDTILVAIGGDGSVHYAAQTALAYGFVLGLIPAGTGNDFAAALGIPSQPVEALEAILSGKPRAVDVVKANDQIILNAGGFGLDASIVHFIEANPWLKRRGSFGYSLSLPIVIGRYKPFSITLRGHQLDERFNHVSLVAVTNGPSFGGGMKLVPTASPFDGRIEVCVVAGISKPELLRVFPRIFKGTHITHPSVHIFGGETFEVGFMRKQNYGQYDGEPIEAIDTVNLQVLRQRLPILL